MLSQKQKATMDFLDASRYLKQVAADDRSKGLFEFTESFIQAVSSFGNSELYAREAARNRGLEIQECIVKEAERKSKEYNEKGLRNLEYAQKSLEQFRKELRAAPKKELDKKEIEMFQNELFPQLAELEMKESDVVKIKEVFASGFEEILEGGSRALPDYLDSKIKNLESIRRQPDRGAVENIPVWKIAAIAVAVGVWIWALFRCKWWGSCSVKEGLAYFIVFWLAALISRFC